MQPVQEGQSVQQLEAKLALKCRCQWLVRARFRARRGPADVIVGQHEQSGVAPAVRGESQQAARARSGESPRVRETAASRLSRSEGRHQLHAPCMSHAP